MCVDFYYYLTNKKIILINKVIEYNIINETSYDIKYFDIYIYFLIFKNIYLIIINKFYLFI
jgi:hypothetical protein